jgi:hypothetical protein
MLPVDKRISGVNPYALPGGVAGEAVAYLMPRFRVICRWCT